MSWQALWLGMLWVVLVLFAIMSVVVTVLGIRDIKTMLARLASQAAEDKGEQTSNDKPTEPLYQGLDLHTDTDDQ